MKENKKQILIIFIIAFIVIMPLLLTNGYVLNDDSEFHIANILSTIKTINIFPKDILPNLFGNYGVGIRQFYPILPHTFIAYLSKLSTLDVGISIKITHLIELFLSGITMYFLSLRLSKDKKIALTSSVIYMLFPYHLSEIYIRDAINESFIYIFIPMIILGLTYLFEDKRKFILFFVVGYVFSILSHLTMMVYFTIFLIPYFIINYKKVFKKDIIKTLLISALLILLILSPTIVNLFQNKLFGDYRVFTPYVMAQGIYHSSLALDYINYFGIFNNATYYGDKYHFYIDIVVLIMLIIFLCNFKKEKITKNKNYLFIFIFGLIAFIMSSYLFYWDILPVSFRIIQFPWRLETFLSLSISILAPLSLKYFKHINYIFLIIIMIILSLLFNTKYSNEGYIDFNNINYERAIGWQYEYLSNKTYNNLDTIRNMEYKIYSDNNYANLIEDNFPNLKFEVNEYSKVQLPRLYYFGYTLIDDNNNEYEIYSNDYGLIESSLNPGIYTLKYTKTKIERISIYISIISILITFIYVVKKR